MHHWYYHSPLPAGYTLTLGASDASPLLYPIPSPSSLFLWPNFKFFFFFFFHFIVMHNLRLICLSRWCTTPSPHFSNVCDASLVHHSPLPAGYALLDTLTLRASDASPLLYPIPSLSSLFLWANFKLLLLLLFSFYSDAQPQAYMSESVIRTTPSPHFSNVCDASLVHHSPLPAGYALLDTL